MSTTLLDHAHHQFRPNNFFNNILLLDEADRMFDMGFVNETTETLLVLPRNVKILMFSATFSREIKSLAQTILQRPTLVEATPENTTVEAIAQQIYRVAKEKKTNLLIKLIQDGNWQQVLVFTRTKHGANNLCKKLESARISAMAIHGNKSQGARTKIIDDFKQGKMVIWLPQILQPAASTLINYLTWLISISHTILKLTFTVLAVLVVQVKKARLYH